MLAAVLLPLAEETFVCSGHLLAWPLQKLSPGHSPLVGRLLCSSHLLLYAFEMKDTPQAVAAELMSHRSSKPSPSEPREAGTGATWLTVLGRGGGWVKRGRC